MMLFNFKDDMLLSVMLGMILICEIWLIGVFEFIVMFSLYVFVFWSSIGKE